jgi:four helix bundle protein
MFALCATANAGCAVLAGLHTARPVHRNVVMNVKAEALKQRTFAFAIAVITFCRVLRKSWEGHELSDQLFRCGTRVGANYRAACRARSHADFVNKLGVVVEEADEAVYWLELIQASGSCRAATLQPLLVEAGELCAIFTQSHITARSNAAHRAPNKPIRQ